MIYVSILVALCPEHFILGTKGFGHPALWRQTLLRRVQHHVPCWQDQEDETSWTIECTWLFVLLPNCIVFLCISICTCTIWIMYRHSAIISSEFFTLLDFNGYFGTPKCGVSKWGFSPLLSRYEPVDMNMSNPQEAQGEMFMMPTV